MRQVIFILTATVCALISCKKDTIATSRSNSATASVSYLPLAIGNYWVYERFVVDTGGTEIYMNKTDSVYISKDTMIAGKTYYYFCQSDTTVIAQGFFPLQEWVYDSSGFILQYGQQPPNGGYTTIFDSVHLNDSIIADTATWGIVSFIVPKAFSSCTVPAGTYSGISMDCKIRYLWPTPHSPSVSVSWTDFVASLGICYFKGGFPTDPKAGYSWKLLRYHV